MSRAFALLLSAREKFYQAGVLRTFRLDHPVISVGNLTLGGTGKTPLVMALAEGMRDQGFRPIVLSRGYRRKSSGVVIVSRGGGPQVPWQEAGDEPFLIARRTRGVAVVVGSDRYEAGRHVERENLGDIFILDDGFQHRRLFRNVDIVAIDPVEWAGGEKLLPTGRWREPRAALSRAHVAAVPADGGVPEGIPIPTLRVETAIDGIFQGSLPVPVDSIRTKPIIAFAGIARPERFFSALEQLGLKPGARIRFRDHHPYTLADVDKLQGEVRITTEKDAVRLEGLGGGFMHLRISAKIPEFDWLMSLIRSRLP